MRETRSLRRGRARAPRSSAVASPSTEGGVATTISRDLTFVEAPLERGERQIFGPNPFERREQPAQHEVASAHGAASLDGEQILHAGHDAEHGADRAFYRGRSSTSTGAPRLAHLGDVTAALAGSQVGRRAKTSSSASRRGRPDSWRNQVKDEALRGFFADARESRRSVHQPRETFGQHDGGPISRTCSEA